MVDDGLALALKRFIEKSENASDLRALREALQIGEIRVQSGGIDSGHDNIIIISGSVIGTQALQGENAERFHDLFSDQIKSLEMKIDVLNNLMGGIGSLATDYTARIQNFLIEYLGTVDNPVPFGGRDKELQALDEWLNDLSAPPYLLIAAEAGRGKSALLARWALSIIERDIANTIFIPISIRHNTSLASVTFTMLAARLGKTYDQFIPAVNFSGEQWHEVCLSLLNREPPDGKPLVVILDGLDEATDWLAGPIWRHLHRHAMCGWLFLGVIWLAM